MKKQFLFFLAGAAAIVFLSACNGSKTGPGDEIADSLAAEIGVRDTVIGGVNAVLDDISMMIDSMAAQEGLLFVGKNKEVLKDRAQIKQNLAAYGQLMGRQKAKLKELQKKLAQSTGSEAQLGKVIGMLIDQLDTKEIEIEEMSYELEDASFDVDHLRNHLWRKDRKIEDQQRVMKAQDKIINECYYLVGSKSELKELGILTSGNLFKKGKVDMGNIPQDRFRPVDIRKFNSLDLPGKKVKLISPAPDGSYEFVETENGNQLKILDPTQFWSVSNYLVVQCD
ncbi:MAG: hypothetical protein J5506_03180 [Prevotella sp.]|nr:hypothetical protein [Prevotella sp.]